jgi:hypothetical protein
MTFDPDTFCSFCNIPGARHEGGGEIEGVTITGRFCDRSCFDKWLLWKGMLISAKIRKVDQTQPVPKEGQAVLEV